MSPKTSAMRQKFEKAKPIAIDSYREQLLRDLDSLIRRKIQCIHFLVGEFLY